MTFNSSQDQEILVVIKMELLLWFASTFNLGILGNLKLASPWPYCPLKYSTEEYYT